MGLALALQWVFYSAFISCHCQVPVVIHSPVSAPCFPCLQDGKEYNVGSPLTRHFFTKMEDGTLKSPGQSLGAELLSLNSMVSYWRLSRDRIRKQLSYRLKEKDLPETVTR